MQAGKFYVTVLKGSDYFPGENEYYGIRRSDTVVAAHVHVPSKATIKIIYKNFSPITADDFFECGPTFLTYGSFVMGVEMKKPDGQPGNPFFYGTDSAFTTKELTGETAGNQYTYIDILIKKNGIRTDLRDSIYIEKGQTKTYEIGF